MTVRTRIDEKKNTKDDEEDIRKDEKINKSRHEREK